MDALRVVLVSAGLLTAAAPCIAQQVGTTFGVSAFVIRGCAIAIPDLAFGNYQALASPPAVFAATTVTVTCALGDTYTIGMNAGANRSGQQRRMARVPGPVSYLNYSLYRDAARTQEWGDTGVNRLDAVGTGAAQSFPVYGTLAGGQSVPAGAYIDTVTVTVRN